jgi:hypothetical protein
MHPGCGTPESSSNWACLFVHVLSLEDSCRVCENSRVKSQRHIPGKQSLLGGVVAPMGPIILAVICNIQQAATLTWDGVKSNRHLNRGWYSNGCLVCGAMCVIYDYLFTEHHSGRQREGRIEAVCSSSTATKGLACEI